MLGVVIVRLIGMAMMVSLVLIILKLAGSITLSWWWVALPFWIYLGATSVVTLILALWLLLLLALQATV